MSQPSTETKALVVARILSSWRRNNNELLSIDNTNFLTFFPFLPITHRLMEGDKPAFIIVNREESIKLVREEYSLHG